MRMRGIGPLFAALALVAGGCHHPEITAVPLSPQNCTEWGGGIPFYLPKPLLIIAKNFRNIEEAKVGQMGPVPIPGDVEGKRERVLLRVPRSEGSALAAALAAIQAGRSARKMPDPLRVQLDPVELS